jgi:hypothetical protein
MSCTFWCPDEKHFKSRERKINKMLKMKSLPCVHPYKMYFLTIVAYEVVH